MYLTSAQVLALTEASLKAFLEISAPEGPYLDYKATMSSKLEKDAKREFLKDVTALANAAGGHLIIGTSEPADGRSVEEQVIGVDDGKLLAQNLERLTTSSIDPRIPGLLVVNIPLTNGKSCIVVHVPPSLGRPHMVTHEGHRSFYVRHSESSDPMSAYEIREAVLTSSSAEARAREYVGNRLAQRRQDSDKPALFVQAMPLMSPDRPWDVFSTSVTAAVRGDARRGKYYHFSDLASNVDPVPTIDGILGKDQREQPAWETEVHRNGYASVYAVNTQTLKILDVDRYVVHSGTCQYIAAFCQLLAELWDATSTDVPYVIACAYLNATGVCLAYKTQWNHFSAPYARREIVWPEHFRRTGDDTSAISESLSAQLFNAFGQKCVS